MTIFFYKGFDPLVKLPPPPLRLRLNKFVLSYYPSKWLKSAYEALPYLNQPIFETKYSRMDEIKFVEDSL